MIPDFPSLPKLLDVMFSGAEYLYAAFLVVSIPILISLQHMVLKRVLGRKHFFSEFLSPRLFRYVKLFGYVVSISICVELGKVIFAYEPPEFLMMPFDVLRILCFFYSLIRLLDGMLSESLRKTVSARNAQLVSVLSICQIASKVLLLFLALLLLLSRVGVDIRAFLAGLGIFGVAVAFAGKSTLENLFGGVTVLLDQPIRVGQYGKFGSFTGTVERIGLRSTQIRTIDRVLVSIPNSTFLSLSVENISARDKMRVSITFKVPLDSFMSRHVKFFQSYRDKLHERNWWDIDSEMMNIVDVADDRFVVNLLGYILTQDYADFLRKRETIMLDLLEVAGVYNLSVFGT